MRARSGSRGQDVTGEPPHARDVNTVFQDYALFPHMTVAENVGYGLRVKRVSRSERDGLVADVLRTVRLDGHGARRPAQLSGGQRQRVALARAIVNRPRVLLLDEPLGALDLKLRQEMQVFLKSLQRDLGMTFIYVTHDQEEALTMSDRIAVFNDGRIEQIGAPEDVYERPLTEFVAGFVGTSNILERDGRRLCVRPERIRFLDEGDPASHRGRRLRRGVHALPRQDRAWRAPRGGATEQSSTARAGRTGTRSAGARPTHSRFPQANRTTGGKDEQAHVWSCSRCLPSGSHSRRQA